MTSNMSVCSLNKQLQTDKTGDVGGRGGVHNTLQYYWTMCTDHFISENSFSFANKHQNAVFIMPKSGTHFQRQTRMSSVRVNRPRDRAGSIRNTCSTSNHDLFRCHTDGGGEAGPDYGSRVLITRQHDCRSHHALLPPPPPPPPPVTPQRS